MTIDRVSFMVMVFLSLWLIPVTGEFSNTSYTVGEWQHVSFVYDGSSIRSYVNGVLKDTVSKTLSTVDSGSGSIGSGNYTASYKYFDGSIEDVRVYNRALSGEEIVQLYDTGI